MIRVLGSDELEFAKRMADQWRATHPRRIATAEALREAEEAVRYFKPEPNEDANAWVINAFAELQRLQKAFDDARAEHERVSHELEAEFRSTCGSGGRWK